MNGPLELQHDVWESDIWDMPQMYYRRPSKDKNMLEKILAEA